MTTAYAPPRTLVDVVDGRIVGVVEIAASPERVFRALASSEIVDWWVNPGVFDTREWSGDVRVGGRWRATGMARGAPYVLEGEFLEVDPPRRLTHTWNLVGAQTPPSTVTYELQAIHGGTRLSLWHAGLSLAEAGKGAAAGWETSLRQLVRRLAAFGPSTHTGAAMTTRGTVEAYFQRLSQKSDWESLLDDDIVFTSYTSPIKRLEGKAAFLGATKRFYGSVVAFEIGQLLVDGARACVTTQYKLRGPAGALFQSDVAELFEVREGKITTFGIYFDTAPFPK